MTTTALEPMPSSSLRSALVLGSDGASDLIATPDVQFSLALNEDQLQIQQWVHDFAQGVIRPAAREWDECEETPWPIIEAAARVGLYSLDFVANAFGDPAGVLMPVVLEEIAWGDAGISTRRNASSSGERSSRTRRSPSSWPT